MLLWLGDKLYRTRWWVVLLAVVLTVFMALYGFQVFDALRGIGIEDPHSESVQARDLLKNTFASKGKNTDTVLVLLSDPRLVATDPQFAQAAQQLSATLKARPEVSAFSSYYTTHSSSFLSHDKHQALLYMEFNTSAGGTKVYDALTPLLKAPPLHVDIGGSLATDIQFNQQLEHDLAFSETIALPLVALLLVLIFNGLVAALLPLLIGGFAIVGSFAILRVITTFTSVSSFATNVITIIGLGLAIDYALFIITRFREELASNPDQVSRAIQRTMATAGRTVLFSGLTVCTSLISLLIFPQDVLRSIGMAMIASALVAMLGSITLLPAILALLGQRVNALSIQRLLRRRQRSASDTRQGAWYRLSYFVMRWSIPITVVAIAFLLLLGTPFLHASFSQTDEHSLPLNASSRIVVEQLKQNFPDQDNSQLTIAVRTPGDALSTENLAKLDTYVSKLKQLKHVTNVQSVVSLAPGLTLAQYQQLYAHPASNPQITEAAKQLAKQNVTEIILTANLDASSDDARSLVKDVRAITPPTDLSRLVGGTPAEDVDQFASLLTTFPYALLLMGVAIFVLLFLMTGSLIMPLKAILLNTLSLTATFGALVWIFQDGHLQNLLQFRAFGSLDSTQPILIFAIAFGLSMDYEVFLLSRIKEQFDRSGDNRESVATGLQRTGWLITSAALLLAIVVAAFASSRILVIQEIGVGISLAILMDATLVRGLLVPAMMNLLGAWNWWAPRPLQVLWQRFGLRESLEDQPTDTLYAPKEEAAPV
ncbi:MMPL family transporter [Ktedonobacter robiniae]|uniref:Membrane protein n=1 Tax=Ktedonobacter robiniae TaxID=2778365 RepID=A0ABQ3V5L2_9CHLR|nr:MMPL family transporter [Ktedonobacter robiniae]GHO59740.1 membrane protein [Ktedonobacter robiniae]